jgi:hypothetical protein
VGDNVNWHVGVSDERIGHTAHMRHAFASIAVVQTTDFSSLDDSKPQRIYSSFQPAEFRPSIQEMEATRSEYVLLKARSAARLLLCFARFQVLVSQLLNR